MAKVALKYPVKSVAAVPQFLAEHEVPTLRALGRGEYGPEAALATVKLAVIELDHFLGLKHRLTEQHVNFIAETIWDEYGGELTMADLNIIFNAFKRGEVELYERLSPPQLLRYIKDYTENRRLAFETYNWDSDNKTYGGKGEARKNLKDAEEMFAAIGFKKLKS